MKKIKILVCVFGVTMLVSLQVIAQYDYSEDLYYDNRLTYEIGTSFGVSNCLTDLGGREGLGDNFIKDLNLNNTKPIGSVYLSFVYNYALALRAEASWTGVKASDDVLKDVKSTTPGRYDRNLSFRSSIFEFALITEIHPRYFKRFKKNENLPRFSPYLLGGIGFFAFNPEAKIDGRWVALEPLKTEGQGFTEYPDRKPYKLTQINFPVGGGFKYKLSPLFNFSTEIVYRILNTDYLDDVSTRYIDQKIFPKYLVGENLTAALALHDRQAEINPSHVPNANAIRGNPKKNDAYFSLNFKLGYIF